MNKTSLISPILVVLYTYTIDINKRLLYYLKGGYIFMDDVVYVDSGVSYYDELERLRFRGRTAVERNLRKEKRLTALDLLNSLVDDYGDVDEIPDTHSDLKEVRELLGAYDDRVVITDVNYLNRRIEDLSKSYQIPKSWFYRYLAYYLDVQYVTVQRKLDLNRFTYAERSVVWAQWHTIERVKNLNVLFEMYTRDRRVIRRPLSVNIGIPHAQQQMLPYFG